MTDIVGKRRIFYLISTLVIIPGLVSLFLFGLKFSIDFTGGTLLEISTTAKTNFSAEELKSFIKEKRIEVYSVQPSGENNWLLRLSPVDEEQSKDLQKSIKEKIGTVSAQTRFETVGPTIGKELTQKAILSVIVASIAIIIYIAWAFRQMPKEVSSWRFGIAAIVALVHDILVVVGIFSLLGHFGNVEIDTLFITALLTVMGFSVHDSIVVFDRIRENLTKFSKVKFSQIVNLSILQTLGRSLSTSLTVLFTLVALLMFSKGSLFWFVFALIIGIVTGTYSSVCNASLILVSWSSWKKKNF